MFVISHPALQTDFAGLRFPNPVGLAAGFDKNASLYNEFSLLGFGFIEVGTVTPLAQEGNPKPRMFRLKNDKALINRLGFNNGGMHNVVANLTNKKTNGIIGGNIGKNKLTPNEEATSDYVKCFESLHAHVDYFVVNVSSPNTPGLRSLQEKEPLMELLNKLQQLNLTQEITKPILLKIAPDLSNEQLNDIIDIVQQSKIAGIIATNTTIGRDNLQSDKSLTQEQGGLSGKPLYDRSTEVIRYIHSQSNGCIPIIAVGGIFSADDAIEKLKAGASLVQVYTGFIYEGPALIKRINKAVLKYRLEQN